MQDDITLLCRTCHRSVMKESDFLRRHVYGYSDKQARIKKGPQCHQCEVYYKQQEETNDTRTTA